jgi:hypothetical protein
MAKQTFTTGQVLTADNMTSLQQTAMGGGSATAKTASYTLVTADAGSTVIMNSGSATTITVDTALFAAGDTVFIVNQGAGVCTITAGTATVSTAGSLAMGENETGQLYFLSTSAAILLNTHNLQPAHPAGGGSMHLPLTTISRLQLRSTTISGISGSYKSLKIYITGVTNNTADGKFSIKYNNETNDSYISVCETGTFTSYQNDFYKTVSNVDRTNGNIAWDLTIFNYADTTYPNKSVLGNFTYFATGVVMKSGTIAGTQYKAAAITSLVFANTGGNFSAGTVLLYGVN